MKKDLIEMREHILCVLLISTKRSGNSYKYHGNKNKNKTNGKHFSPKRRLHFCFYFSLTYKLRKIPNIHKIK